MARRPGSCWAAPTWSGSWPGTRWPGRCAPDKLALAALEATLAGPPPPVAVALGAGEAGLRGRAARVCAALAAAGLDARTARTQAAVGGGGAPGVPLASTAVSLPAELAVPLRAGSAVAAGNLPAVVGRVEGGRLLLDLRAVDPAEDDALTAAVLAAAEPGAAG